ncbi:MAG: hypothetical protein ACRDJT_05660, partial [Actinomycetota bacterium]
AQASATFEVGLICGHVADVPVYGSRHRKVSAGGGWMCRRCERVLTIVDVQGVPGEYDIEVSDLDRMASDLQANERRGARSRSARSSSSIGRRGGATESTHPRSGRNRRGRVPELGARRGSDLMAAGGGVVGRHRALLRGRVLPVKRGGVAHH